MRTGIMSFTYKGVVFVNNRYWAVLATYLFTQFSIVLVLPLLLRITSLSQNDIVIYWTISSFIIGVFVTLLIMRPFMTFPKDERLEVGNVITWTILGIFMAYGAQIVANLIQQAIFGVDVSSENTESIMAIAKAYPLFVIIPILSAPILEEILFRKILFGVLHERIGFMLSAIISSTVFSLIHDDLQHFLVYFAMGFVFAYLYAKTRRILVPILVHMTLNTVTVFVLFFELVPVP